MTDHKPARKADQCNPPHNLFKSQYSLNYLNTCKMLIPNSRSIEDLVRAANLVPAEDIPTLLPYVRAVAVQRCQATLQRAHGDKKMSKLQLSNYERYANLAERGKSLTETTLLTALHHKVAMSQQNWNKNNKHE